MERLVAEEYILDTMTFFEGNRVQCAQRLASEPPCPLITRTCFAQHAIERLRLLGSACRVVSGLAPRSRRYSVVSIQAVSYCTDHV